MNVNTMAGAGAKAPAVVTTMAAVVAAGAAVGMVVAGAAGAYMGRGHAGMRQQMR